MKLSWQTLPLALSLSLGALLGGMAACDVLPPVACTAVGCSDGADLQVLSADGQPVTKFHGVVRLESGRELAYTCPSDGIIMTPPFEFACGGNEVDFDAQEPVVSATVISGEANESGEVDLRPLIHELTPNGDQCGPICHRAEAEIRLTARP